jgi:hypothetical protein
VREYLGSRPAPLLTRERTVGNRARVSSFVPKQDGEALTFSST